jgi:hypothetical protein
MSDWTYDSEPRARGLKKLQDALDKVAQDAIDEAAAELAPVAKAAEEATAVPPSSVMAGRSRSDTPAVSWIGGGGTMGGGGKMGGACLTINIMGPTYGLDDFEDRVTEAIRDGVRRGGFEDVLNTSGCR